MIPWVIVGLSWVLAALGASLLAGASLIPYEWIRRSLDRYAADGSADAYTLAIHAGIVGRVRYAGLGLFMAGVLVYVYRTRLVSAVRVLRVSAAALCRDVRAAVRHAWADAPPAHRAALVMVAAAGVGIRLAYLAGWPIRYDEAFTFLHYARYPPILGLTRYDFPNNHLFHTLLVHVAFRLFGDAPWALRLPTFVAGMCVLPATYLAVRTLHGRDAALLASAVVATAMAGVEISTYARGYSTVTLLFLGLLCLGAYLRRADHAAGWTLFAGLGALMLYPVPTGLYALAAVVAWLALEAWAGDLAAPPRRFMRHLVLAVVATGILTAAMYAPILIRTDPVTLLATNPIVALKVRPVPLSMFLAGNVDRMVDTWGRWASDRAVVLQILWLIGLGVAVVCHRRVACHRVPFVAGLVLGATPILLAQRVVPPSRIWVFLLPVFAGMGAAGLLYLARGLLGRTGRASWMPGLAIGAALLLTVAGALTVSERSRVYEYNWSEFPGAAQVVAALAAQVRAGDKIVVHGMSLTPFLYYAYRQQLPYLVYVYDYVLEGWGPLRDARRVFLVVNERALDRRGDTLQRGLADAHLTGSLASVELATAEGAHVYLITRE